MNRLLALLFAILASTPAASVEMPLAGAGVLERNGVTDCSAVLIAPDLAATAGHCAGSMQVEEEGGEDRIVFRTGAYPGRPATDWPVEGIFVHPMHHGSRSNIALGLRHDAAILRLRTPVPNDVAEPVPMASTPPELGERLLLATWPGGAGQRARERLCPVVQVNDGLISLECSVIPGESGGAVLRLTPEGPVLVGIVVAKAKTDARPGALAFMAESQILQIRAIYLD